jgi:hypothetical protein
MRRLILPVACYLGVTLGVPIADGNSHDPRFAEHAAIVLGGSLAVLAIVHGIQKVIVTWTPRPSRNP